MHRLLAPYALKWNPFTPEVPTEALFLTPRIESFSQRICNIVREGGFAAIFGPSGCGKSATLRLLSKRLSGLRDITFATLTRPHSGVIDFYRELGELFDVPIKPNNRWMSSKGLREKWLAYFDNSLSRPVLFVDEAQEMKPQILNELRLLMSKNLDSCTLMTVVIAGDQRLKEMLLFPELLPLKSRLRLQLFLEELSREELLTCLRHCLNAAGNPKLMTAELMAALVDHSAGNLRALMNSANELLEAGLLRDGCVLDEKLFFEVFAAPPSPRRTQGSRR